MAVNADAADLTSSNLAKNWVTIDLADYARSRDEIDKRSALSAQLLNFQIILVAAVLSSYDKIPKETLIGVSCLSSVLWLMWIDHTSQIYKLAAYVELVVARRLRLAYPDALGWERFLRQIETPSIVGQVLGRAAGSPKITIMQTEYITRYIQTLFIGSAVGLALLYSVVFWDRQVPPQGRLVTDSTFTVLQINGWLMDPLHTVLLVFALILLLSAYIANVRLSASCKVIGEAIQAGGPP